MNVVLLFVILGAVVLGYYLVSLRRYPRVPCRWCEREGAAGPGDAAAVRPVRALRRQGLEGPMGHSHDREAVKMMAWLEAATGLIVAALMPYCDGWDRACSWPGGRGRAETGGRDGNGNRDRAAPSRSAAGHRAAMAGVGLLRDTIGRRPKGN